MLTLHNEFRDKLYQITNLSMKVNKNDKQKIMNMIKDHVEEIETLYNSNNDHWSM